MAPLDITDATRLLKIAVGMEWLSVQTAIEIRQRLLAGQKDIADQITLEDLHTRCRATTQ